MPTKPWREIERHMSPEQLARSDAEADALQTGVMIHRLRTQMGLTQEELAKRLGVTQQAVSKMEWGDDIQVGTLNRVVAALGAELVVHTTEGDFSLTDAATAAR